MNRLENLKAEIDSDPLGRGYSAMDDEAVAVSLNGTVDRTRNLAGLTGDVVFDATDSTEFGGLTDHKQQLWLAFCGRFEIDPFGSANVAFVQWIFGSGATTIANLGSLRNEAINRATELGLGRVRPGDVQQARAI